MNFVDGDNLDSLIFGKEKKVGVAIYKKCSHNYNYAYTSLIAETT